MKVSGDGSVTDMISMTFKAAEESITWNHNTKKTFTIDRSIVGLYNCRAILAQDYWSIQQGPEKRYSE